VNTRTDDTLTPPETDLPVGTIPEEPDTPSRQLRLPAPVGDVLLALGAAAPLALPALAVLPFTLLTGYLWILVLVLAALAVGRAIEAFAPDAATPERLALPKTWLMAAPAVFLALVLLVRAATGIAHAVATFHAKPVPDVRVDGAGRVLHLVSDPIQAFFAEHGQGLALAPGQLMLGWFAGLGVVFIAAVLGSRGGMVGFTVLGAATTAITWLGSHDSAHRPVAAGAVLLAWSLLAVPGLRRVTTRRTPIVNVAMVPPRPAGEIGGSGR
jgi:hypothetical protein